MNNAITPLRILPADVDPVATAKPQGEGFLETLRGALEDVDHLQGQAQTQVSQMLSGNGLDVHKAMIAVEKADLAFQLMLQVRNKIVQAYQEVARMQF